MKINMNWGLTAWFIGSYVISFIVGYKLTMNHLKKRPLEPMSNADKLVRRIWSKNQIVV